MMKPTTLTPRPRTYLRRIVAAVVLGSMAALPVPASSAASAAADRAQHKPTVVLVHGAWADSSSWAGVVRGLQTDGYEVIAPANPLRSLASDSEHLEELLDTIEGPVVLVGHSYGAAVISNAAAQDQDVKALVYINGSVPAEGEAVGPLAGPDSALAVADPSTIFTFVPGSTPAHRRERCLPEEVDVPRRLRDRIGAEAGHHAVGHAEVDHAGGPERAGDGRRLADDSQLVPGRHEGPGHPAERAAPAGAQGRVDGGALHGGPPWPDHEAEAGRSHHRACRPRHALIDRVSVGRPPPHLHLRVQDGPLARRTHPCQITTSSARHSRSPMPPPSRRTSTT